MFGSGFGLYNPLQNQCNQLSGQQMGQLGQLYNNTTNFQYYCSFCRAPFVTQKSLEQHLYTFHTLLSKITMTKDIVLVAGNKTQQKEFKLDKDGEIPEDAIEYASEQADTNRESVYILTVKKVAKRERKVTLEDV